MGKMSNRIFNNPDFGTFYHRPAVVVLDSTTTVLPSAAPSMSADSVSLSAGDLVLFTALTDATKNNQIYKVVKEGLNLNLELAKNGQRNDGLSVSGEMVLVKQGSHADELWTFSAGVWEIADIDTNVEDDAEVAKEALINDATTSTTTTWSSDKISTEIAAGGGGGGLYLGAVSSNPLSPTVGQMWLLVIPPTAATITQITSFNPIGSIIIDKSPSASLETFNSEIASAFQGNPNFVINFVSTAGITPGGVPVSPGQVEVTPNVNDPMGQGMTINYVAGTVIWSDIAAALNTFAAGFFTTLLTSTIMTINGPFINQPVTEDYMITFGVNGSPASPESYQLKGYTGTQTVNL